LYFSRKVRPHYFLYAGKNRERFEFWTMKNIFDTLLEIGHDEDFVPIVTEDFRPTDAPAGSPAKLEVLAERIRSGLPLWHPEDRADFARLTGTVRPRDST
jgi:hypothetical protein